jgi:DNA topoisomerase-1
MQENLVIVESPAKAKTIEKFLGKDYIVKSSFGHIRDLQKKGLGIDIKNHYEPAYLISDDKKAVVAELSKLAKGARTVWLASDEDREGEAIAWHLYQVLGLTPEKTRRIVFHEITRNAILHAVETPREIDMNLVNAQQARRVLDRLVGFELSPVLWKKVKPSLSAGRVQSVAVKLIVEREKEIIAFTPNDYFRIVGQFLSAAGSLFTAELNKRLTNADQARKLLAACRKARFTVRGIDKKPARKSPAPPFTTSTLQQEASRKLGMSVGQTMSIAQRLYEAGLITYMRTDSQNLSREAIGAIAAEVKQHFGEKYLEIRQYKTTAKGAQEAHEAIRPSYVDRPSIEGSPQEKRLYDLIWKRTVASQMAQAEIDRTIAEIEIEGNREHHFTATGEVITFDGFLRLYTESSDDEPGDNQEGMLPALKAGETVTENGITATQRFTSPAARYSEASLVKRLEELGIGRPSTYAPTISTIIQRGYVVKESREGGKRKFLEISLKDGSVAESTKSETFGTEKQKLFPTDIGIVVTDFLEEQFPAILDYHFTANVEEEFDRIAEGQTAWADMIDRFYHPFHDTVENVTENSQRATNARLLGNDPASGLPVYARIGRFGPYVQLGENEEENGKKPQYANLATGQLLATITLDEAMCLFQLPRTVGQYENKDAVIGVGRFGPYVRHDGKFVSLKKGDNPYSVTIERTIELIEENANKNAKKSSKHSPKIPSSKFSTAVGAPTSVTTARTTNSPKPPFPQPSPSKTVSTSSMPNSHPPSPKSNPRLKREGNRRETRSDSTKILEKRDAFSKKRPSLNPRSLRLSSRRKFFLLDSRFFTRQFAQVVNSCATNHADLVQLDAVDVRRIKRENALHAHAVRNLADGEHFSHTRAFHLDHSAAKTLQAFLAPLDDLVRYSDGIATLEPGQVFLFPKEVFGDPDQFFVHCFTDEKFKRGIYADSHVLARDSSTFGQQR